MDIYQLRYFVAVAETGSFTKAATRSHISQPSLSQQILNLEEEIGQNLFHRLGRKVTLTDAGHLLLERARQIITDADNTLRELRDDPKLGHRVAVGAVQTVANFFLPAVVAHCRANDIPIRLRSLENFRAAILDALIEGEIDWGLVSVPVNDTRLEATPIFREPLLLAVAASHPLAEKPAVRFSDLSSQNFIMLGDASSLTAQVQRIGIEHDFDPNITHHCAQLATVKALTAMGLGVSILPQTARSAYDPAGLVYRRFADSAPTREIGLVRHRRRHLSKGAALFAEAAKAVVGPLEMPARPAPKPGFAPPGKL